MSTKQLTKKGKVLDCVQLYFQQAPRHQLRLHPRTYSERVADSAWTGYRHVFLQLRQAAGATTDRVKQLTKDLRR
jgi:hypothetical protein